MACLRTFDSKDALFDVLESADLVGRRGSDRYHDQSCVDVFEVWPLILVNGQWCDDTKQPSKWTANICRDRTAAKAKKLAELLVDDPARPVRVCA